MRAVVPPVLVARLAEVSRHADKLISQLCVIGPEVTWSDILSCDWLKALLAPPFRSGADVLLRVSAAAVLKTPAEEPARQELFAEPQP